MKEAGAFNGLPRELRNTMQPDIEDGAQKKKGCQREQDLPPAP